MVVSRIFRKIFLPPGCPSIDWRATLLFSLNQYEENGSIYDEYNLAHIHGAATVGGTETDTKNLKIQSLLHEQMDDDFVVIDRLTRYFFNHVEM